MSDDPYYHNGQMVGRHQIAVLRLLHDAHPAAVPTKAIVDGHRWPSSRSRDNVLTSLRLRGLIDWVLQPRPRVSYALTREGLALAQGLPAAWENPIFTVRQLRDPGAVRDTGNVHISVFAGQERQTLQLCGTLIMRPVEAHALLGILGSDRRVRVER